MHAKYMPVFFTVGQSHYRLHFPYLLSDFDKSMLAEDEGGRFVSEVREYYIKGYVYNNVTYDIHVREDGVDIQPMRIEANFFIGGKPAEVPQDLRGLIRERNEQASRNRILIYLNGNMV